MPLSDSHMARHARNSWNMISPMIQAGLQGRKPAGSSTHGRLQPGYCKARPTACTSQCQGRRKTVCRRPLTVAWQLRASSTDTESQRSGRPLEERGDELQLDPESEEGKKKAEADRLRRAEKFMTIGTGRALCVSCGYEYEEKRGDQEYPITPGTKFSELPKDWQCPVCGAPKESFQSRAVKVAGFAENQQYGFGGNSLTSGQKSILIYGALIFFFGLFLAGYTLQ